MEENHRHQLSICEAPPTDTDDVVGLVNLPLHSLFSHVECQLQQKSISDVGTNYPYKAYIDTLLTTKESNRVLNASQLFVKDSAGQFDEADVKTGTNSGLYERWIYTRDGGLLDLDGPIMLDLFSQEKPILNGIPLDLTLWPSKHAFRLMSNTSTPDEKVQIVDATLKNCLQRPNPALTMAHEKLLEKTPAIYPYMTSSIKIASIAKGEFSFSADNVFQGEVPSQLVLGMVSSSAYIGDYMKSPFSFQHFDCNFVAFYVDGQSLPAKPLQPNFAAGNYVNAYRSLQKDTWIDREEFAKGYTLFLLDLNPYVDFNVKRRAHCRLELRFAKALPESVTLVMYGKFPENPCGRSGQHWMAFYFSRKGRPCEFFDSLGRPPEHYHTRVKNVLIANGPNYIYLKDRLQDVDSDVCGQYCIYYVVHRLQGKTMMDICRDFVKYKYEENDTFVRNRIDAL